MSERPPMSDPPADDRSRTGSQREPDSAEPTPERQDETGSQGGAETGAQTRAESRGEPRADSGAAPRERRRRRYSRRLLRLVLWTLAVVAVLVLAGWWLSGTDWVRVRAIGLLEARLEETLGREVRVGDLDYGFRPLTAVATDVVIPGPEGATDPPFARVPRVEVEVSFRGYFRPVLTVERVELERPQVWLLFDEDGSNNFPDIRTGQGGGRLEVRIGRLSVEGGLVHLDERQIPLTVEAGPVRAVLEGPAAAPAVAADHLAATVVVGDLAIGLPEARPWGGSASARALLGPGRVEVTGGLLRGPDLAGRFEMVYTFEGEQRSGEVELTATGDARLANRLGYLEEPISGPFDLVAEVELGDAGTTFRGDLTSSALRFGPRRFSDVEALVSGGDEGIVVEVLEAEHAGGTLAATLTLPAEPGDDEVDAGEERAGEEGAEEGRPVVVEASAKDLRLAALVDALDLGDSPLAGLTGRASADLVYRFDTTVPLAGSGSGVIRLAGVERSGELRLPLSGRVPLEIDGGVLTIADAALTAPGQRVTASGSYDLDGGSGVFQYRLESERLGRLVRALPLPPELTAEGVPPWLPTAGTGTVSGEIELRPGGGYSVEAAAELAAVETALGRFDRIAAPINLEDGVLSTDDLVVEGEGQRLMLAGSVDLETRAVEADFRLTSADLGRLVDLVPLEAAEPTAAEDDAAEPPWLPEGGHGRVEGDLALSPAGVLTGRAQVDLEAVRLAGLTFERINGAARLTPGAVRDLRLEVATGDGALVVSGSAPLPAFGEGAPTDWQREPFDLSLVAASWPLSTVAAFVPTAPEMEGAVDVEAEVSGTFEVPRGRVQASVAPLSVAGYELERVAADLRLDGERLVVDDLRVTAPAGTVVAEGSWDRGSGALELRLDSDGLDLAAAPLAELVPGDLAGEVAVQATVGGTVENPRVRLTSTATGLELAGEPLGAGGEAGGGEEAVGEEDGATGTAAFQATWTGETLEAAGSLLGVVDFEGGGRLTTEEADLEIALTVPDVDGLLHLAAGAPLEGLSGDLAGTLAVSGRFDAPTGADASLTLDPVRLAYQGREVRNLEPVVLRYEGGEPGRLVVESLFLGEPEGLGGATVPGEGELFVTGTVGLGEGFPLDLRAQADLSATWAELVLEDLELSGRVQALASVRGTATDPRVSGQGELSDARLILPDFPHALEDIDAIALFYPDRVVLDSADARLGGGRVRAAGSLALEGLTEGDPDYRFQVQLRDATLRYPEGFLLRGGGDVTLTTTPDGRLISGVVNLERAFYLRDVELGVVQLLQNVFEPSRLDAGTADPVLAATQLNVSVQGPGALRVRNNVADLSGDLDLVVRGNLADPAIFGQVELTPGGEVVYAENEYEVERGLITFANPYRIDPVIDFVATTEVRNYDITLNLAGTLDDLEVGFSSDPPLADLEVVSLLTIGRPIEPGSVLAGSPAAEGGAGGASRAAEQLLYGQAASLISERVNTLFGFDTFRVAPGTGAAGTSSVAVTVGQQISRDVFVTYSRDPSAPEEDLIQIEWQAYENVLLVLTRRGETTYALDVQVERRF